MSINNLKLQEEYDKWEKKRNGNHQNVIYPVENSAENFNSNTLNVRLFTYDVI